MTVNYAQTDRHAYTHAYIARLSVRKLRKPETHRQKGGKS